MGMLSPALIMPLRPMNKIDDEMILSTPLLLALAAMYFVLVWKPRQSNAEVVARASGVFWGTLLAMVLLVFVYANFLRT